MTDYTIVEQSIKQLKSHAKRYGVSYKLKCYFLSQTVDNLLNETMNKLDKKRDAHE